MLKHASGSPTYMSRGVDRHSSARFDLGGHIGKAAKVVRISLEFTHQFMPRRLAESRQSIIRSSQKAFRRAVSLNLRGWSRNSRLGFGSSTWAKRLKFFSHGHERRIYICVYLRYENAHDIHMTLLHVMKINDIIRRPRQFQIMRCQHSKASSLHIFLKVI